MSMKIIPPSREEFDAVVEKILGKFEYRHLRNGYKDLIDRIRTSIEDWLRKWLEGKTIKFNEAGDTPFYLSNGVLIFAIVLIVLIILLLFLLLHRMLGKNAKVKRIYGEIIDEKTTTEQLLDKSNKCKEKGDYREAIRYGFIAVLVKLNEKNLLYLDEAMTNSEMINLLRKNDFEYSEAFEGLVSIFNQVWYGHKAVNEDKYSSWEGLIDILLKGVMSIEKA